MKISPTKFVEEKKALYLCNPNADKHVNNLINTKQILN